MKPAMKVLIPISMALILSGCETMPEFWKLDGDAEPLQTKTIQEPVKTEQPVKLSLKQLIEKDVAANRLSKPSGNNAIEKIERLRKQSPNDPDIKRYERSVIKRYASLADKRIKRRATPTRTDLEKALSYINTARSLLVPSPLLDKKEEEIIELLDIVIQKEQLEKARAAEPLVPPPVEEIVPVVKEPVQESIQPNPHLNNPNFVALKQDQITNRSQDINIQLDSISQRIVTEGATVVIHAQSMDDFRYLKSSLRTSLYWVDSNFNLNAEPHIEERVSPGIQIVAGE